MGWEQLRRDLFPGELEKDEGFRQEILRQSHAGLKVIGFITVAAALFMMVGWWLMFRQSPSSHIRYITDLTIIGIGILALLIARKDWSYPYARWISVVIVEIITVVLIASSLYLAVFDATAEDFIPSQMTLSILILVIAQPLPPWMVTVHCAVVAAIYAGLVRLAAATFAPDSGVNPEYFLFLAMMGLLATIVSVVLLRQRWAAYSSYVETLKAASEVRRAQSRLALSESASSMARLAAAISHEINTPIGALASAVDTLLLLGARQATAPAEQQPRLVKLQSDLRRSIQESAQRLQQIAARVARFTNLDQAKVQHTRVNDLITDVAEFVKPRLKSGEELSLDLNPVSDVVGNPQQLSALFYDLLNNSAGALNGNGRIYVRTRQRPQCVEVVIEDNGRGIGRDKLQNIFDPGFQESTGRVSTGNWSMFNARQIVLEHGGEISIASKPGQGTTVTISLPLGELT